MNAKVTIAMVIIIMIGFVGKSAIDDLRVAADAYIYGYPLLIMEETRRASERSGKDNVLRHMRQFPEADFRLVVRPNFDTLYSSAWINLADGPAIISMPDTGDRYYVLPFMDAWTNVFARTGTSTTGNSEQEVALVGPDYVGELPVGLTRIIRSPTNMVWLIGRIEANGLEDVAAVRLIQDKMALTSLSGWLNGERRRGIDSTLDAASLNPMFVVEQMNAQAFFISLNQLMAEQSPSKADVSELAKFSHLNIAPGVDFRLDDRRWLQAIMLQKALDITRNKLNESALEDRSNDQGWRVLRSSIGTYGTDYLMRAAIAKYGLGALPPSEAAYPSSSRTADKEPLDGSKYNYRLHFDADELPPVNAFWSLTAYDSRGYLKKNEISRFTIGNRSPLQFNNDGSLDIYIQHERPLSNSNNWLPAPRETFNVMLRLYDPKAAFINGEWIIPPIEKIEILK
jgi:hypothetical protein